MRNIPPTTTAVLLLALTAFTSADDLCAVLQHQFAGKPCQCIQDIGTPPAIGDDVSGAHSDPASTQGESTTAATAPTVGCNRGTMPQILTAIKTFPARTRLAKLWLWDNVMPLVPSYFFKNVTTTALVMETSEVGAFLPGALQRLGGGLVELELRSNALDRIGDGMFDGLSGLKRLCVSGNRLPRVTRRDFAGLRALRELSLQRNKLASIEAGSFNDLTELEALDMSFNRLSAVTKDTLGGLVRLQSLSLASNALSRFEPGATAPLRNLKILDLSNNNLSSLDGIDTLPRLQKLYLSNNSISSLRDIDLSRFPALRILHLDKNGLTEIPPGSFEGAAKLTILSLTNNQIRTIEPGAFAGLAALETLSLQQNHIGDIPASAFGELSALKRLFLSHNKLSSLDRLSLDGLASLRTLNLGHNQIAEIEPDALGGLDALEKLYLNDNQLEVVDNVTVASLPRSLQVADISGNPWRCTCDDIWFADWFTSRGLSPHLTSEPTTESNRAHAEHDSAFPKDNRHPLIFIQTHRTTCKSRHHLSTISSTSVDQPASDKRGDTDNSGSQFSRRCGALGHARLGSNGLPSAVDVVPASVLQSNTSAYITSLALILGALSVLIIVGICVLFYRDHAAKLKLAQLSSSLPPHLVVSGQSGGPNGLFVRSRYNGSDTIHPVVRGIMSPTNARSGGSGQTVPGRSGGQAKKSVTIRLPHDMVRLLPANNDSSNSSLNQI